MYQKAPTTKRSASLDEYLKGKRLQATEERQGKQDEVFKKSKIIRRTPTKEEEPRVEDMDMMLRPIREIKEEVKKNNEELKDEIKQSC